MQNWPADKVERRPIETLVPYARNSRTHSDEQVAQIAASMKEWGWTNPVLVDEAGMIIAGHGRVLAARKLGLTEVPVMVATGWSEGDGRAFAEIDAARYDPQNDSAASYDAAITAKREQLEAAE